MSYQSNKAKDLAAYLYRLVHRSPNLGVNYENTARYRKNTTRRNDPIPAFAAMANLITQYDWDQQIDTAGIQNRWIDVVGNYMAGNTTLVEIEQRKAKISVKDSSWATQVKLMRATIIEQINKFAGKPIVDDITIVSSEKPKRKGGFRGGRRGQARNP